MPERKFDDFDKHAQGYREVHTRNIRLSGADSYYFAEMKVRLLKRFEKNTPLKVLDVGCGDGATELYFQKYFPSWQLTGIDVSGKSIEEAKKKNITTAVFELYNGTNINAPDDEFDIVFMAGVLHHIDFSLHDNILKEVWRVLKKHGRFYLFEHNPINPFTRYLVNTCEFDKDARLLENTYTSSLLRSRQFRVIKKEFIIFFPRKGLLSGLLFLEKYLHWLPLGGQYFFVSEKV
ncbi:MAG TPA: class I SAM-dependent methyltransferase [Ferruginibacter sp.]|nr:class I SAM-dependent methyltransferase [Ferruginibacter sp.]